MPLSAKITTKVAEYKNPDRYARIHNPENKKRRYTLCLTLIVLISWSSPVPARLWISSRWRPPMTCVYLHHLKVQKKNVIKIYLNRRIEPQKIPLMRHLRLRGIHFVLKAIYKILIQHFFPCFPIRQKHSQEIIESL